MRFLTILGVLLWLTVSPLQGQDTLRVLSLERALELAYRQHPRLRQLQQAWMAARARRVLLTGLEGPMVSFYREGIPSSGASSFAEQRWTIDQTIPSPLQAYFSYRAGGYTVRALEEELDDLRLAVKRDVKKAYTEVLFARTILSLQQEAIRLAEEVLQTTTLRMEAGEATELDRLKAEVQLAEARNSEAQARRAYHAARYALFETIGLPPEAQRYDIEFSDSLRYREAHFPQEAVLQRLPDQPLLRARQWAVEAARTDVRARQYAWLPDASLQYYWQDYGTGYRYHGFLLGLRLPLVRTAPGLREARARWREQQEIYRQTHLALKRQAEGAWHGYEVALENIRRFQETIGRQSETLLRLTLEAYRAGSLDLLGLLDTQRTYLNSRMRYYEALRDYYLRLVELEYFLQQDIVLEE